MPGPSYLTGERLYLRAPIKEDIGASTSWYPSVFPVGSGKAEAYLKDHLKAVWWADDEFHLIAVRIDDDRVVGGVIIEHPIGPAAEISFRLSSTLTLPDADLVLADILKVLVPWLLNEAEVLTITVSVGADQTRALAVAEEIGMFWQVRLRQFLARPGGRVDMIQLQAINPRRAARVADDQTGQDGSQR